MIEAQHKLSAHLLLRWYLSNSFSRYFHGVYLLDSVPEIPAEDPIILAPNHSSWWDGFLAYAINRQTYRRRFYILMLESELQKYKFFAKVGAFSIDPGAPKQITKSIHYMSSLCTEEKSICMVFFPQGALLPNVPESYNFKGGLTLVNPKRTSWIIPTYFQIESGRQPKPIYYLVLGEPIEFDKYRSQPETLRDAFYEVRNRCSKALLNPTTVWRTLYGKPHKSMIELS